MTCVANLGIRIFSIEDGTVDVVDDTVVVDEDAPLRLLSFALSKTHRSKHFTPIPSYCNINPNRSAMAISTASSAPASVCSNRQAKTERAMG